VQDAKYDEGYVRELNEKAVAIFKELIPTDDSRERVEQAYRQANTAVRKSICQHTGLTLSHDGTRQTIPVRIADGFPVPLAETIIANDDPMLWRVILAEPMLDGMISGLGHLTEKWEHFESWPDLPPSARNGQPLLDGALRIANALKDLPGPTAIFDQIREIEEDILGTYRFPLGRSSWVELYWMPIALVASAKNVRIEDLTVVVLAHELAHAYTHKGRDIDGRQWLDPDFGESDIKVLEGLAQYYTDVTARHLRVRWPEMIKAFKALLELQSEPYRVHKTWLEDSPQQRAEVIRFSLIQARTRDAIAHDQWLDIMAETQARLESS
jgi:hypothetical protein